MKIENYAIVNVWEGVFPRISDLVVSKVGEISEEDGFSQVVIGNIYGREGVDEHRVSHTSRIKEITEDGKVITESGNVYELGAKHPDYIAFEKAVAEGMPVMKMWRLGQKEAGGSIYIQGMRGYEAGEFREEVISQEGAVVTVADGTKFFVDWFSTFVVQRQSLGRAHTRGTLEGRTFCGWAFEPDIFKNDWTFSRKGAGAISWGEDLENWFT